MPNLKSMASGDLTITLCRVGSFRAGRHGDQMRKLLTFLIALGAVAFGVCSPASAWGCREFGQQGGTGCNSVIASAPPPSTTTWNTTDSAAGITRSNGNLTLTYTSGVAFQGVRGTNSHSTGKYYFELTTAINAGATDVGIANAAFVTTNPLWANTADSIGYRGDTGAVETNGTVLATVQTWNDNTISVATDLGAMLLWVRVDAGNWNNSGTADPATGVGGISFASLNVGPYFPAINLHDTGEVNTANFGATAYAETVPAGSSNW
jgi:hypothetical protein